MGLGKTLTVLSLMVCDLGPSNQEWLRKPPAKPGDPQLSHSVLAIGKKKLISLPLISLVLLG